MTQDEIIRMARDAGSLVFQSNFCESSFDFNLEQIERFYQLAFAAGAAHEREKQAEQEPVAIDWEPLQNFWRNNSGVDWEELESAVKCAVAALGKPIAEQEPVAEVHNTDTPSNWSIIKPGLPAGTKLYAAPVRTKDLTKTEMLTEAVEAGFMLHTGYGQGANKMMPVSDSATLVEFARAVIATDREKNK